MKPKNHLHQIINKLCKIGFCYSACPNLGGIVAYAKPFYHFIIFFVFHNNQMWVF